MEPEERGQPEQVVPWQYRLSTRLTLLLLGVVAVLTVAMGVLLWRGLAELVRLRAGVTLEPGLPGLEALGAEADFDRRDAAVVLRSTLVNLVVVVAVTLVAATAFSRSLLADPLARLTRATRALAAGDLGARADVHDASEIGVLARSFDTMADALAAAQDRLEARVAARTTELRGLLELSNTIAVTTELGTQMSAVLNRLVTSGSAVAGEVLELEPSGRLRAVASIGLVPASHITPRSAEDDGAPASGSVGGLASAAVVEGDALALPLRARDEVVGVLHAYAPKGRGWEEEHLDLAAGLAAQAAVAIENARLYERARGQAAYEERRSLARDLHDSVSQAMYATVLSAHTAQRRLAAGDLEGTSSALDSAVELAEGGLAEMRALIFELRPEALAEVGLVGALERQLEGLELRHGLETEARLAEEPDLPFTAKQELLRVVQEALHNVAKHARARRVAVRLTQRSGGEVEISVEDDGQGFDVDSAKPGHLGLTTMHERVAALGGHLSVDSAQGRGTRVTLSVPGSPGGPTS